MGEYMKHRILFHSNPCYLKTGLAENAKTLLKYLYKTGKYEIAHYCSQVSEADPQLSLTPWKSYGALPSDPQSIQMLNQDPGKARDAAYGAWNIDKVVKDFKPTIYIGSDDSWGFNGYPDRIWWNQINSVLHITLDSLPIIEGAYEQAKKTKHYLTWAKFAANEMKRNPQFAHVGQLYGAMDTNKFQPIKQEERASLRQRFGIDDKTTVFLFVGRNQLRKQFVQCLEAFAHFRRENPTAKAKLWFHTSYSEKANGWDIVKMATYYGIPMSEILATYICKSCGEWFVAPYGGEDLNCPVCKAEKSLITVNIVNGVADEKMKYVYGISDACVSCFSSGGLEYHNVQSLLCGKPLASTNYSSGADFCEQSFVHKLGFTTYIEQGTNFIKATTSIRDIRDFYVRVWKMSQKDRDIWGERGRVWAKQTFSIETIGAQWETLFDSMSIPNWDDINLTPSPKNDSFPFPQIDDEDKFIETLYKEILKMDEPVHGEGFRNWKHQLKNGMTRQAVYDFFLNVARQENAKHQVVTQDFSSLLDKTTGRKRALIVMRQSMGDCLMLTQLLESFHEQYKDHDLYIACEPRFAAIFAGCPHVFRVLPYQDFMESEMACIGSGRPKEDSLFSVYMHPAIQSQRQLNYLSINNVSHNLTE
jgi:glycosyltransferase involved in cell wall biosynthesis